MNRRHRIKVCYRNRLSVAPSGVPDDYFIRSGYRCLCMGVSSSFVRTVARSCLSGSQSGVELIPIFRTHGLRLRRLLELLRVRLRRNKQEKRLCLSSLTRTLTVGLLRSCSTATFPVIRSGKKLNSRGLLRIAHCVSRTLSRSVGLTSLTRLMKIDRSRFDHLFGRSAKLSPRRCLLRRQIRQTGRLLGCSNRSLMSVTLTYKFSDRDRFDERFHGVAKAAPAGFHGGWTCFVLGERRGSLFFETLRVSG